MGSFSRWHHGWNVVAACVLSGMSAVALTINCASFFYLEWVRDFGVPASMLALGVTLFSLVSAATAYLIGICVSRFPPRWLVGGGLALLALVHFLVAASSHAWQFLAIYALALPGAVGLCGSIMGQAMVSRWFDRQAGMAMGVIAAALALPGILLPPLIVWLLPVAGWRPIWTGFGLFILLVLLPLCWLTIRNPRPVERNRDAVLRPEGVAADARTLDFATIVQRRNFWIVVAAFMAVQFVPMTIFINITPIVKSYGGTPALAGLFLTIFSGVALVAKLSSGWLSDRIGNRWPLAVTGMATGAGALALAMPLADAGHLILTAVAAGISGAIWTLLASTLHAEFGTAGFSRAYGLASTFAPLTTLAPATVAFVRERTGSYQWPLTVLGAMALLAALCVFLFLGRQGGGEPDGAELPFRPGHGGTRPAR